MPHRSIPVVIATLTAALAVAVPASISAAAPAHGGSSAAASAAGGSASALQPVTPALAATDSATAPPGPTNGAATPAGTRVAITVVLTPSDRSALRSLVRHTGELSTASRSDRVADLEPAAAGRHDVERALRAAGFTVSGSRAWDVEATGTAAQAEALFGVDLVGTGDGVHPTSTPMMPNAFHGAATTVLGLDTRPVVSPSAIPGGLTPADLASAYSASASSTAGSGATIATIQFSGWNSSDLSTYAAAAGRAMPSVTQVSVDKASTTTVTGGGDLEVALDQEMLLAAAPAAAQRIYFAPLSASGMYDVYTQIASDVAAQHITAVSTSWGSCETSMSANLRAVLEDALDRIVAAGATMFAASGDTGATCKDSNGTATSVVFPASSPAVVGVGGTTLTKSGSTWSESVWNNSSGASGGGASASARPSWQSGVGIAGSTRLVPDIAGTSDPSKGPGVYIKSAGGWVLGGGTSLAAPLMAAELTASLTGRGCAVGVGDVHSVLYAHPADFRDVTSGTNGTYSARSGYDESTGLGSPVWSSLVKDLPTPSGCTATASATSAPPAAPAVTPGIAADGTRAVGTTTLSTGQGIHSPSGQYRLTVTNDGDLVETGNGRVLWSAITASNPGGRLVLQDDGNAVLTDSSGASVWSTGTAGSGSGVVLSLSDTGLVALAQGGTSLWSNGRPGADTVAGGGVLLPGQSVWDTGLRRQLALSASGNLTLVINGRTVWASGTAGRGVRRAVLRADGSLVLLGARGRVAWSSGAAGGPGSTLTVQSNGDVVISHAGTVVWSTRTSG
jgi:pseudomonalisin